MLLRQESPEDLTKFLYLALEVSRSGLRELFVNYLTLALLPSEKLGT